VLLFPSNFYVINYCKHFYCEMVPILRLSYVNLQFKIILQVITGYLLAGSIIGPGGFSFVNEMVQVRCFHLCGLLFSLTLNLYGSTVLHLK
jgi:hypothetical protein